MEFRILGAVEVWSEQTRVDVGGRQPRLVLAALLLEPDRVVPVDRLIDLVWGESPPPSARGTLQALVSRLRTVLRRIGAPVEIVSRGAGYLVRVDPDTVDAHRFTALTARARTAGDEAAVELLDRALGLWRGEALADVADDDVRHRLCAGLTEARWTAVEDRAEALLRLGRARQVVGELTDQVARQPGRQRLVGRLMLALHREGRADEALATYQRVRALLAEELGLDPAPELRRLQQLILRADPALGLPGGAGRAAIRPAELPHDVPGFTGRDADLARLDATLHEPSTGTRIWVVSGTAGVGKTALAVHWAHRVRDAFPDGQLYLDLRGFDAEREPVPPSAALAQLLGGLGVGPGAVPDELDARAALFRSLLSGRDVLLVLDNARDVGQVLPLIPSVGTVLVTSRHRLGELVVRAGARTLPLDVLTPTDSARLLAALLGDRAVQAEAAAAAQLARLCGHLPLALRIAAANLQADGEPQIAGLARELAEGDPLAGLTVDGAEEGAVTKAFALSYRALPGEQRRMFRRLGLVPGSSFAAGAAGALVAAAPAVAERLLRALVAAHLVEAQPGGRYRCHDLLRRYAVDRVTREEDSTRRGRARQRLLDHYLETADAAGRRLIPHFVRLPRPVPADPFPTTEAALAWLDAEWTNVTAAVEQAARHGPRRYAWHLTDALRAYFHQRGRREEWLAAATVALAAARAEDDPRAQAAMHQSIALVHVTSGRYDEARLHLLDGLRIDVGDDWPEGRAGMLNNLSAVHQRLGDPQAALTCARRSLELNRQLGIDGGEVMSLANLGFAYWQLGELAEADEHFRAALERGERAGARYNVAVLLVDLANARRDLGDHHAAEELYARALVANRELGYRYGEATALAGRAVLWCATGRAAAARPDAERAVALTREIGDTGTEAWTLDALGRVLLALGRPTEAAAEHHRALELARRTRFCWGEATALAGLADAGLAAGDLDAAREHGRAASALAVRAGYRLIEIRAARVLARVAEASGDVVRAARPDERAGRPARETG
ncbi:tetratricopeptide repeat protein [Micromonospora sp. DR5-3]|uniref:AfsR/SARP family transcriptional regulator n=1 Tax=unclassified Micromonospora TaxID=2617518 RepID=UPI0011D7824F|nr:MULTISPECIES: BTAD domain-containing putative transcriptional regulator [unclassified Micromonospora]MCW3815244.1 tetratricopeptide repeat protein [Micromonospora sp. DR5-3]TYC21325.1 tetratricopeptide repeat protein [Micromonospora sp. MP36]